VRPLAASIKHCKTQSTAISSPPTQPLGAALKKAKGCEARTKDLAQELVVALKVQKERCAAQNAAVGKFLRGDIGGICQPQTPAPA